MKQTLFSLGTLLALTLIVIGCGGGDNQTTPVAGNNSTGTTSQVNSTKMVVSSTGTTTHPSQEVVKIFLTELLRNNTKEALALFTPKAQEEYAKTNSVFDPTEFMGMEFRIRESVPLTDVDNDAYGVYVTMVDSEGDEIETVWGVRKVGSEYRISELMMSFEGQILRLNFEDPAGTRAEAQQQFVNQPNQPPAITPPAMQQPPQQMAQPNMPNIQ